MHRLLVFMVCRRSWSNFTLRGQRKAREAKRLTRRTAQSCGHRKPCRKRREGKEGDAEARGLADAFRAVQSGQARALAPSAMDACCFCFAAASGIRKDCRRQRMRQPARWALGSLKACFFVACYRSAACCEQARTFRNRSLYERMGCSYSCRVL